METGNGKPFMRKRGGNYWVVIQVSKKISVNQGPSNKAIRGGRLESSFSRFKKLNR